MNKLKSFILKQINKADDMLADYKEYSTLIVEDKNTQLNDAHQNVISIYNNFFNESKVVKDLKTTNLAFDKYYDNIEVIDSVFGTEKYKYTKLSKCFKRLQPDDVKDVNDLHSCVQVKEKECSNDIDNCLTTLIDAVTKAKDQQEFEKYKQKLKSKPFDNGMLR